MRERGPPRQPCHRGRLRWQWHAVGCERCAWMRAACWGERGSRERRRGWSCVGRECARVVVSALVCIVWQMSYEGGIWPTASTGRLGEERVFPDPATPTRPTPLCRMSRFERYRYLSYIQYRNIDISNIVLLILLPSPTPDAGEQVSAGRDHEITDLLTGPSPSPLALGS